MPRTVAYGFRGTRVVLSGFDIVCLASQDWNSHLGVPQQTMARLARSNRVIYVDPPRSLTSARSGWRKSNPEHDLHLDVAAAAKVQREVPPTVSLPLHALPAALSEMVQHINGNLLKGWFRDLMRRHGVNHPLLWVFEAAAAAHVPHFGAVPMVYDCIDEWAGYFPPGSNHHANITRMDTWLCQRADAVFCGSESLMARKAGLNGNIHVVHHAADFDHFSKAGLAETKVPDDIAGIARPIVGVMGILDKRVDIALLAAIARTRPDWSLVFVGPVQANLDIGPLSGIANVHFLGGRTVSELPACVKGFDVCLIPYVIDDFTRSIYPLKLHEYLAGGKPVVSTPIPAVRAHGDVAIIADGAEGFVRAIEHALKDTAPERNEARIACARQNAWDIRIAQKCRIVEDTIAIRNISTATKETTP